MGEATLEFPSIEVPEESLNSVYEFVLKGVADGAVVQNISQIQDSTDATAVPGSASTELYNGATITQKQVTETGAAPAGSVLTTAQGISCVFTAQGVAPTATYQAEPLGAVSLINGELGSVAVPATLIG